MKNRGGEQGPSTGKTALEAENKKQSRAKQVASGNDPKKKKSQDKWLRVRAQLEARLGSDVFNSWFGRLKLVSTDGGVALHSVPTVFLKSWINSHYRNLLLEVWQKEDSSLLRVDISVRTAVRRNMIEKKPEADIDTKPKDKNVFAKAGEGFISRDNPFHGRSFRDQPQGFSGSHLIQVTHLQPSLKASPTAWCMQLRAQWRTV
ncbi:MAG: hypothetical protein JKX91_08745 [Rhizobiaceae bacterium]|nr:hypothetical protein [Rhizobiaceae bacterium]